MEFNVEKCKVVKLGKGTMNPSLKIKIWSNQNRMAQEEKDLGVTF